MTLPAFSERVRIVLIHAGWTPDRAWDTRLARSAHEARGLPFPPAADTFLRAFGGLRIDGPSGVLVTTDATLTLSGVADETLREYEAWVGEPLAVVGSAQAGAQLLLMSARGALYGAKSEILIAYGTNLAEVFDRLCIERTTRRYELN